MNKIAKWIIIIILWLAAVGIGGYFGYQAISGYYATPKVDVTTLQWAMIALSVVLVIAGFLVWAIVKSE